MGGSPFPTVAGWSETGSWIAQRHRAERNTTGKNERESKINKLGENGQFGKTAPLSTSEGTNHLFSSAH